MKSNFLLFIASIFVLSSTVFAQTAEPEIMSYKDYGRIRHERPYILEFKTGRGELFYFGAGHFYSYEDPQAARLEAEFLKFRPTVVLNESGTPKPAATAGEAVERSGEPGLLSYLAAKHNVPIKSLDPPRLEEIKYILGLKRWTPEQVMLFYVLRRVPENNKKTNPAPPESLVLEPLKMAAQMPGFEMLPKTLEEFEASFKKHFPDLKDWRQIEQRVFDPNPDLGRFTNDIADASVNFRGKYMIRLLTEEVAKGERVFAVVGASHVVKQERALRKAFEPKSSAVKN